MCFKYPLCGNYFERLVFSETHFHYSLAVEELPKHKQYEGFSSAEKSKAEASLRDAFMKAEDLKERLKKKYHEDALIWTKQEVDRKAALVCSSYFWYPLRCEKFISSSGSCIEYIFLLQLFC